MLFGMNRYSKTNIKNSTGEKRGDGSRVVDSAETSNENDKVIVTNLNTMECFLEH